MWTMCCHRIGEACCRLCTNAPQCGLLGATALPQPGEVAHRTLRFEVGGFGRPASEAMGMGTVGHGSTWLWERMQAQPSRRGRSMTKVLGPCWLHVGRGGRFWKRSCCRLIVALHLKQTHSGCHILVDGWWTGAQAKCRKSGSSCHASSSSALAGSINKRRGQHRMTVCSGGGGAAVISGVGVLTLLGSVWGGCGRRYPCWRHCSFSWSSHSGAHGLRQAGHEGRS